MNPIFEQKYGVLVDTRIPEKERLALYQHWQDWMDGRDKTFTSVDNSFNLTSRIEHMIIGSTVGFPYDPFKPLAALAQNADLERIRRVRNKNYRATPDLRFYPILIKNFEAVTGLSQFEYVIAVNKPDMDDNGRIPIPRVIGVYSDRGIKVPLDEAILEQIQLPTTRKIKLLGIGTLVREVFDFDNYRIEYTEGEEE